MKIWAENDGDFGITIHLVEPKTYRAKYGYWQERCDLVRIDEAVWAKVFKLPTPVPPELHEIDLAGKPHLVCTWVPVEKGGDDDYRSHHPPA